MTAIATTAMMRVVVENSFFESVEAGAEKTYSQGHVDDPRR
jgi:hypothetical protein